MLKSLNILLSAVSSSESQIHLAFDPNWDTSLSIWPPLSALGLSLCPEIPEKHLLPSVVIRHQFSLVFIVKIIICTVHNHSIRSVTFFHFFF